MSKRQAVLLWAGLIGAAALWSRPYGAPILLLVLPPVLYWWLRTRLIGPDRTIGRLLAVGYGMRVMFALLYTIVVARMGLKVDLFGDARAYVWHGLYIARSLVGERLPDDPETVWVITEAYPAEIGGGFPSLNAYGTTGYAYLLGLLFAVLGYSPLGARLLNVGLSMAASLLLYRTMVDMASNGDGERARRAARIATGLYLVFPTLILWSVTTLRESLVQVVFLLVVRALVRIARRPGAVLGVVAAVGMIVLGTLRLPLVIAPLAAAGSLVVLALARKTTGLSRLAFLTALGLAVMVGLWLAQPILIAALKEALERGWNWVQAGGSTYRIFPEDAYVFRGGDVLVFMSLGDVVTAYGKALLYFFLAPFPWELRAWPHLLVLPQMLVWYALLPGLVVGAVRGLRAWTFPFLGLVICLAVSASIIAMGAGNVGALIRVRDTVVPLVLMLSVPVTLSWLRGGPRHPDQRSFLQA